MKLQVNSLLERSVSLGLFLLQRYIRISQLTKILKLNVFFLSHDPLTHNSKRF